MQEITDSSIPDGGTVEYRLITPPPGLYDDLVITTIFFPPKRKKPLSHFIILNTPLMRPSRYYHQGLLSNGGGINRVPL